VRQCLATILVSQYTLPAADARTTSGRVRGITTCRAWLTPRIDRMKLPAAPDNDDTGEAGAPAANFDSQRRSLMEIARSPRAAHLQPVARARAFVVLLAVAFVAVAGSGRAAAAPPEQPIAASRFSITIDGVEIASFSELGSIVSAVEVAPPTSAMPSGAVVKTATVTLRRGLTRGIEVWAWHEMVARSGPGAARKNGSLVMYDQSNKPVARFYLENAWPAKVELEPGLAAKGPADTPMESVTLVCEHIQRVAP